MKKTALLILVLVMAGCAGKATEDRSAAVQSRMDSMFEELDTGKAPDTPVVPTGNKAYDRAQEQADKGFKELNCEIDGNCPVPGQPAKQVPTPEKPAEMQIAEKPRPSKISDKEKPAAHTKYPMQNGKPIWFSDPSYGGYLGGIGIAGSQKDGYSVQKRIAVSLAQADLARNVEVNVYTELESEKLLVSRDTVSYYKEKFSTLSRHEAEDYLASFEIMDEWTDPATGELYVWVVLPK